MSLHSTGHTPAPAPLLPAAPLLPPDLLAQLPPQVLPQHLQDLATLLSHAAPASHKLVIDVYMRKHYPDLWRAASEQARQMKAEARPPTAANEPRMISKERIDDELPLGTDNDLRRAAANVQDDGTWHPMFTDTENSIFQDPASIQSFYNELNHYACSGSTCRSGNGVHLDYTGPRPHDAVEPFNYPILIDKDLRHLDPAGFQATGNRLHAVSIPAPYPHMYDRPPRNREAVAVMASGGECEHITPYQPASCTPFTGGDPIAQIDKFFNDNRARGKVPGVVFVEGAVIDQWAKDTRMKGTTALAIRPDKVIIWVMGGLGGLIVFSTLVAALCCGRNKLRQCPGASVRLLRAGWEKGKSAVGVLWNMRSRRPLAPPVKPARPTRKNDTEDYAEESSIVIEDSDSGSTYLGDFSSSHSSSGTGGTTGQSRSNDCRSSDS